MPYGKKPMMMKMGSKEKNTPMNFSEKAMKYMKDMPALYGPKSAGLKKLAEAKLAKRQQPKELEHNKC